MNCGFADWLVNSALYPLVPYGLKAAIKNKMRFRRRWPVVFGWRRPKGHSPHSAGGLVCQLAFVLAWEYADDATPHFVLRICTQSACSCSVRSEPRWPRWMTSARSLLAESSGYCSNRPSMCSTQGVTRPARSFGLRRGGATRSPPPRTCSPSGSSPTTAWPLVICSVPRLPPSNIQDHFHFPPRSSLPSPKPLGLHSRKAALLRWPDLC
jgi:hypothetical protein